VFQGLYKETKLFEEKENSLGETFWKDSPKKPRAKDG
tara:strand:- start:1219 stop:1329 length:111 start_codon:yes stop_codon:yes gene_type:complete